MSRQPYTATPSPVDPDTGRSRWRARFRHLSVHVADRFECRTEGGGRVAPPRDRVLSDPGLIEGRQSELPQGRVGGLCPRTPGGQDRDAQGLDLRLQAVGLRGGGASRSVARQCAADKCRRIGVRGSAQRSHDLPTAGESTPLKRRGSYRLTVDSDWMGNGNVHGCLSRQSRSSRSANRRIKAGSAESARSEISNPR